MGLLNSILSPLAGNVNPEVLTDVAVSLVNNGVVSKADFGAVLFGGLTIGTGENAPATTAAPAVAAAPALTPAQALDVIYGLFDNYRRRSMSALMAATNLPEQAIRSLIVGNGDFRVSTGRRSGKAYVSIRS